uniref:Uncharacterized protein n=1 Tax=Oryza punctata TaxID=4537 RepID=A0A0E0K121_ORYPU
MELARKTKEVDHLLAKLENEGVEIDGKIARIRAEAARENLDKTKENVMTILLTVASVAVGFIMGAEWYERACLPCVKCRTKRRHEGQE